MHTISRDTPALNLTAVAKHRLPVFRTDAIKPSKILQYINGIISRRVIDHLKQHGHNSSLRKLQRESGARGHKYSLWEHHSNAVPIFSEDMLMQKVNYIHQNPVRAGLVERAEVYRWSSIRCWRRCPLEDEPLIVDIDRIVWRRGVAS